MKHVHNFVSYPYEINLKIYVQAQWSGHDIAAIKITVLAQKENSDLSKWLQLVTFILFSNYTVCEV